MAKKEIKLSATRISTFLQCPQKYWFQYHDHLPKVPSPAFRLGIAVHESLELAGNMWVKKGKFTKTDKKKIIDKYVEYLPNVTSSGNGPGKKEIFIRGSATDQTSVTIGPANGTAPGVALYVD